MSFDKKFKYVPGANKFKVTIDITRIDSMSAINRAWAHWHVVAFIGFIESKADIQIDLNMTTLIGVSGQRVSLWSIAGDRVMIQIKEELSDFVSDNITIDDFWQCIEKWYDEAFDTALTELDLVHKKIANAGEVWNNYRKILKHEETT